MHLLKITYAKDILNKLNKYTGRIFAILCYISFKCLFVIKQDKFATIAV